MTQTARNTLYDAKAGDELWVLNGARTRAFLVKVFIASEVLVVSNTDKDGALLEFDYEGRPIVEENVKFKGELPLLVPFDNPTAGLLEQQRVNREMHEEVRKAVKDYAAAPTLDNWVAVLALMDEWKANNERTFG